MESIYSKFIGTDNSILGPKKNFLSRSSSLPMYSFKAKKLPPNISNSIVNPFPENNDIYQPKSKIDFLEEKISLIQNDLKLNNDKLKVLSIFNPLLFSANNILNPSINFQNKYNELYDNNYKYNFINRDTGKPYNSDYIPIRQNIKNKIKNYEKQIKKIKKDLAQINNKKIKFNKNFEKQIHSPIDDDNNILMQNMNYEIQKNLENDNIKLNLEINKMNDNCNEIKTILESKLTNIENKQKSDFENLKNFIQNSGGKKMLCSFKNVFEGAEYDLQKADECDLIDNLQKINFNKMVYDKVENKKNKERLNEYINEQKEKMNEMLIMREEAKKEKIVKEMEHEKMLNEIKRKQEMNFAEQLREINKIKFEIMRKEKEEEMKKENERKKMEMIQKEKMRIFNNNRYNINGNKIKNKYHRIDYNNIDEFSTDELINMYILKNKDQVIKN